MSKPLRSITLPHYIAFGGIPPSKDKDIEIKHLEKELDNISKMIEQQRAKINQMMINMYGSHEVPLPDAVKEHPSFQYLLGEIEREMIILCALDNHKIIGEVELKRVKEEKELPKLEGEEAKKSFRQLREGLHD